MYNNRLPINEDLRALKPTATELLDDVERGQRIAQNAGWNHLPVGVGISFCVGGSWQQ